MPGTTGTTRTSRSVLTAVVVASATAAMLAQATHASAAGDLVVKPATKGAASTFKDGNYVVILKDSPLASYSGTVPGYAATRPAAGGRLSLGTTAAGRYRTYLTKQQDALIRFAGVKPRTRYTVTLNGFAGRLSSAQASKLARTPGVLAVTPDKIVSARTTETPSLLGLTGPNGVWAKLGGTAGAGKGVVVGVIDSGIWPENPSFTGQPVTNPVVQPVGVPFRQLSGRIAMRKADGGLFTGACQAGEQFTANLCNSKLLAAQYFGAGLLAAVGGKAGLEELEVISPRDGDGHGTHTASTAAGNQVRNAVVNGRNFGTASGMAPAAKISSYKALWKLKSNPGSANGATSDLVAAIDQAVIDGVDVINYSVGGAGGGGVIEAAEISFLNAAAAGVFVAASAGNDGPGFNTTDHNSPWLTTVAATTIHRFLGTVKLGNGTKLRGSSINGTAVPASPAVLAAAAAVGGAAGAQAALCAPGSLDAAKATGKVVVCDRGVVDRVAKSAEVKRVGGVGMVLVNLTANSLDADVHAVPTVHVDEKAGATVKAYVSSAANPTIAIEVGDTTGLKPVTVPQVAGFSSRGPALGVGADLIKPDIAAPGVSIIASAAPNRHNGDKWTPLSGTSMSAPHIAGLGALILQKYPRWSPTAVKSAMMTTATDTVDANGKPATDPYAQGAGFVSPRKFLDPGLIYDASVNDYYGYLEDQGFDTKTGVKPISGSNLNQPSIGIGSLAGVQTVTRRVTAVKAGTYTAKWTLPGIAVKISPSVLKFAKAGETKSFTVSFIRGNAKLGRFTSGFLTWTGPKVTVRSPLSVRPVLISAPEEIQIPPSASGAGTFPVKLGAPSIPVNVKGLVPGTVTRGTVTTGPQVAPPAANASNVLVPVTVPANTTLMRAELLAEDPNDLDLYVYDSAYKLVASSATGSAGELVDVLGLAAGQYYVQVVGFATPAAGAPFTLRTFAVGNTAVGNVTVTPRTLTGPIGSTRNVSVAWSGLTAGTPYLGWIQYGTGADKTILSVG